MKKKSLIFVITAIIGIVVFIAWSLMPTTIYKKTINKPVMKIGIVTPVTGMGKELEELAKATPYMLGQLKNDYVDYELIVEDSQGQAMRGFLAAKKLINVDKVDVIVSHVSAVSKLISPLATQKNILHITGSMDADLKNNPTTFSYWAKPDRQSEKFIEYLNNHNYKNVAVLVLKNATSQTLYDSFEKAAAKTDIKVTKYEINPGIRDYRLDLLKLKQHPYDLVCFIVYSSDIDVVLKQYKELNMNTPISSIDAFSLVENKALIEGKVYIDSDKGDKAALEKIRIGAQTTGTYAFGLTNDALSFVNLAIEKFYQENKKIPNGEELMAALLKEKKFQGIAGKITLDEDRIFVVEPVFVKIIEGKPVVVEE